MDDDATSAIDDSGATQVFGRPPRVPRSDAGDVPVAFEYGRRSGHWTAGDTVFGSGIDDGCPTVVHLPLRYGDVNHGGEGGRVQPLSAAALKKLKKATEEDEKKRAAVRAETEAEAEAREKAQAAATNGHAGAASEATVPPRGFYMPKRRGLGIRIVSKDGKSHVVAQPQSVAKTTAPTTRAPSEAKTQTAPAPAAAVVTEKPTSKAPSAASHPPSSVHRRVRIAGKNGEEAFVELPVLQTSSRPESYVYVPAGIGDTKLSQGPDPSAARTGERSEEKAKQEQMAAAVAKKLRVERERLEKEGKDRRKRQAKAAADVLMSGGLGGSGKSSPAEKAGSAHSARSASTRSASVINGIFDNGSKAPSKASSRTMTPPPARVASMRAASHAAGEQAKAVSVAGWQSAGGRDGQSQKAAPDGRWSQPGSPAEVARESRAASAKAASPHPGQGSKQASDSDWQPLGSGVKRPSQDKSNDSWKGIDAVYKVPSAKPQPSFSQPPAPSVQRQRAETPPSRPLSLTSTQISRKIAAIHNWNDATPSTPSALPSLQSNSVHAPAGLGIDTRLANARETSQDTIFAGTGWISPHPLSCAPSSFGMSPQDQISVRGGKMTYEEYKRLKEGVGSDVGVGGEVARRNWSRTSSERRTLEGGRWGVGDAATGSVGVGAQGSGSGSSGRNQEGNGWENYRAPTVGSEHSSRSEVRLSASQTSRIQSTLSDSQRSVAPGTHQSFNDSPPAVGQWGSPQPDGRVSATQDDGWGREEVTWREPGRTESPLNLGDPGSDGDDASGLRGGSGSWKGSGRTQIAMPWDREAHAGSWKG